MQPAVIDPRCSTTLTYHQLDERVRERSRQLRSLGLRTAHRLGLYLSNRLEFVELLHASLRVGTVLVPFNLRLPGQELERQIQAIQPACIVTEDRFAADLPSGTGSSSVLTLRELSRGGRPRPALPRPCPMRVPPLNGAVPRVILFTSGTTGSPKAPVLTDQNLRWSVYQSGLRLGARSGDLWLSPLPMYHMGGIAPVLRSLFHGSSLLLADPDPSSIVQTVGRFNPSCMSIVPTLLHDILEQNPDWQGSSFRFILVGGAKTQPALVESCEKRRVPIHTTYGMTETASQIATARPGEVFENPRTVGRPLRFVRLRILDELGEQLPPGEPGNIVVSGPTVFPGYLDSPERNQSVLSPHGFSTGDRGYLDRKGRLTVLQRQSERITSGGETVEPEAVRSVLVDHEFVKEAAVVGLEHPRWGEQVAALVVPVDASLPVREALDEWCKTQLADFKRPRLIGLCSSLPRSASGTVQRSRVKEKLSRLRP